MKETGLMFPNDVSLDEALPLFHISVFSSKTKTRKTETNLKTVSDFLSKDFLTGLDLKCFKDLIQEDGLRY